MPGISKYDKELICALSSIPHPHHRQIIINSLNKDATEKVRKHVRLLLQNRRKNYRLPATELEALAKSLRSYKSKLRYFCEGKEQTGGGRGGRATSKLGHAVSVLLPIIADCISRTLFK